MVNHPLLGAGRCTEDGAVVARDVEGTVDGGDGNADGAHRVLAPVAHLPSPRAVHGRARRAAAEDDLEGERRAVDGDRRLLGVARGVEPDEKDLVTDGLRRVPRTVE